MFVCLILGCIPFLSTHSRLSEEDLLGFFPPKMTFCVKKVEIKQNVSRIAVQLSCYILILGKIPVANTDLVITYIHKCITGLEDFCDDPVLVKTVESQTCSKIFAVEILEKSDIPLLVLYDTSGEDDININATCLKALYDKSLELHLQVPFSCFCLNSLKTIGCYDLAWTKNSTQIIVGVIFFFPLCCQNLAIAGRFTIYKCQSNQCFL